MIATATERHSAASPRLEGPLRGWDLPAGAVALPGFVDHHMHLFAAAAARLSVDVGPAVAGDVEGVVAAVRAAAEGVPAGEWIRAWGFDEAFLAERRAPTAAELDRATDRHPVVLRDRTGHVSVVNSAARALLGEGVPPDGVLVDAEDVLAAVPPLPREAFAAAVAAVSADLAAAGVTSITDATVTNSPADAELFAELRRAGHLRQRAGLLAGGGELEAFRAAGLGFGDELDGIAIGHAKSYVTEATTREALAERIAAAGALNWPVALHVMGLVEADVAIECLAAAPPPTGTRHRIEHLALSLPEHVRALAGLPVTVVTNPGFLPERGAKYRRELSREERGWLYRVAALLDAGIDLRGGTDAPVAAAEPLRAIAAAVERRDEFGVIGAAEAVDPATALALFGGGQAALDRGDVVVLGADPLAAPGIAAIPVLATFVGGRLVHAAADCLEQMPTTLAEDLEGVP